MNKGEARRDFILKELSQEKVPVSASRLAKKIGVSRQIIVGDVALMRASGTAIVATSRGYRLEKPEAGLTFQIASVHTKEQTEQELMLIIENGGAVLDVSVEHPLYGEIKGGLYLYNEQDVKDFMAKVRKQAPTLLSSLTEGLHLHTLLVQTPDDIEKIKHALREVGMLYED